MAKNRITFTDDFVLRNEKVGIGTTISFNASLEPSGSNLLLYYRPSTPYAKHHIAFYSIGESLDLALLDNRVTDLINALAVAIP